MTPRGVEVPSLEQKAETRRRQSHERVCPECGETRMRRSRRRTLLDYVLSVAGLRPYRCHECGHRFHARSRSRSQPRRRWSRWAECPRCGFPGVNRIARNKVPRTWGNLPWRVLPVSGYRCPECRNRFFDCRPSRQKEAEPS